MINPKIRSLTAACERAIWYIKTGCIVEHKSYETYDYAVIELQKQGINVVRRDHSFGILRIDGVSKINNEWQLINFSGNDAEIQLGLKLSGLKKCYQHDGYDEQKADDYLKRYYRKSLPNRMSDKCSNDCPAFDYCYERKIPRPSKHNSYDDGRVHLYKPEFFAQNLNYYNKKFEGNMYGNFINGRESFSGLPAFTSKQIAQQFNTFVEFKTYLQAPK